MPNTAHETVLHVAVGIIGRRTKAGDEVLLALRPPDVHQGGLWEFPGGKLEADEDVLQALDRELHEELGIRVQQAAPLMRLAHRYADKSVLLDVWRILRYHGDPTGREGQSLRWVACRTLDEYTFPAANLPIVRTLQWPSLYLISHVRAYGESGFMPKLETALKAGARWIQLREPQLQQDAFVGLARRVAERVHAYGAKLLVNADPDWVALCHADGVHLNTRRLMSHTRRPLDASLLVAASCHNRAELQQAQAVDADFVVLSPVKPTQSHPHGPPLGWQGMQDLIATSALPVYALGGMGLDDMRPAMDRGAHGVAMIGAVWTAADIAAFVAACMATTRW